jgi:hypothetical protein
MSRSITLPAGRFQMEMSEVVDPLPSTQDPQRESLGGVNRRTDATVTPEGMAVSIPRSGVWPEYPLVHSIKVLDAVEVNDTAGQMVIEWILNEDAQATTVELVTVHTPPREPAMCPHVMD